MKTSYLAVMVMLLCWIAPPASGSSVQLIFGIDPAETLPAIPVNFRVRAINSGSTPALMRPGVRLELRAADATEWKAVCFSTTENNECAEPFVVDQDDPTKLSITIPAGEERALDFLAGPQSPPWFEHADLLKPGTYRLRLVAAGISETMDTVVSNEQLLTVRTPAGADAGAWQLFGDQPHVSMARGAAAEQLWDRYPDSIYTAITPRTVPANGQWPAYIAALNEALQKNPPSGFADAFKYGIAYAHRRLSEDAAREFNVQKAYQHALAAQSLFEELAAKELEATLRAEVKKQVDGPPITLSAVESWVEQLRGGPVPRNCERSAAQIIRTKLVSLSDDANDKDQRSLAAAIADLEEFDQTAGRTPVDMHRALSSLEQAVVRIESVRLAEARKASRDLTDIARLAAQKAIEASAAGAKIKQSDLDLARREFEEALAAMDVADYRKATARFREALHKAEGASSARGAFC